MSATTAEADALMRQAFPLHQAGQIDDAEALYLRILDIAPDYFDAHYLRGCIAQQRGDPESAIQHVRQALRHKSDEPAFHRTLAECYTMLGLWNEAIAYYENTLRLDPDTPMDWNGLGNAFRELGDLDNAARCFEEFLKRSPDSPPALNNVGLVRIATGDVAGALPLLRRACELDPDNPDFASSFLFTLNLNPGHSRDEVFREHLAFDQRFGAGRYGVPACPTPDPDPERRLKIAYFSPDLRSHPVNAFIAPVLSHHDRKAFEVSCYYLYPSEDDVTRRLKALSDRWIACAAASDDAIAQRLQEDAIDIVVDLAGHTGWNRLPVLARKPAPVIATWLGYLNTTGMRAIDYRITDAFSDPPGAEQYHCERLVRLPEGHSCFERPPYAVAVNELPALGHGAVRFGSFNRTSKLTDTMLRSWARLLAAAPGSSLLIACVAENRRARVRSAFEADGIDPSRVECRGVIPLDVMLAAHHEVDIALDTYPYTGTTTTLNSLWMGVPVVTLAGAGAISRGSGSLLAALGLNDWIATTPEGYVEIAARQAVDLAGLVRLRQSLRARLESSSLMNAPRFTRQLEAAYRDMWRAHCTAVANAGG